MTPRSDAEAEWLVIDTLGDVVASQDLFDDVVAELAQARAIEPELATVADPRDPDSSLLLMFDEPTLSDVVAGRYADWDCVNELYRATPGEETLGFVPVFIPGRFRSDVVRVDYEQLPGVELVGQSDPPSGVLRDVCLELRDSDRLYVFREFPHCNEARECDEDRYWGFSAANGIVRSLGDFDAAVEPAPRWFIEAGACSSAQ